MKHQIYLTLVLLDLLALSTQAQPARPDSAEKQPKATANSTATAEDNVMYRLRMFALPESVANDLMAKPEMKSEPCIVLKLITSLIAEKKARVVANPVIVAKSGERVKVEGAARFEVDGVLTTNSRSVKLMLALNYQGGGKLMFDSEMNIGETEFIGTIDLPASARTPPTPETCLVFLSLQ